MIFSQRQTPNERKTFTHVKSSTNYQMGHRCTGKFTPLFLQFARRKFFIPLPQKHNSAHRISPIKSCCATRTSAPTADKNPVVLSARKEEDRCVDSEIQRASNCGSRSSTTPTRKIRIRRMRTSRSGYIRPGHYDVSTLMPYYNDLNAS